MSSESDTATSLPVLGDLTYREIHAFEEGLYSGYIGSNDNDGYTKERHYWRTGYVTGDILAEFVKDD